MIINVWRPVSKNKIIIRYDICENDEIYKKGSTGLKVIYKCDGIDCKFPNNTHSITRCHLNINRSINMCENLQICRSCQTSGNKNPKYGDNRTWYQVMGRERSEEMKNRYRDKFIGIKNPSKSIDVKNKKNQIVINFENISEFVSKSGYTLNDISGDNKYADLSLRCDKGHDFTMKYLNFKIGHRCVYCYHESMRIPLDDIQNFKKYSKFVRYRSRSTFLKNRILIDPSGLKLKDSNKYHIDHIYSVADGFRNNVDPKIISSMVNLRVVTSNDNLKKGGKSDIKLEDLLEKYNSIKL